MVYIIRIGFRTIKTAVGAGLAIWLSTLFNLEFATFSAIIVIMCIEKTKTRTLITMKEKFFASLLSLFLGAAFFELIGYHPIAFSLFVLLFIPFLVKLHIQAGFVTSMVVVLHVYTVENATIALFLNELYLIFIGMGIALLVNSVMPNLKRDINAYKVTIENKFARILYEFSAYLRDKERNWDGKEIIEAETIMHEAKTIAIQDVENNLLKKITDDYYYLKMREDQLALLKHMLKIVANVAAADMHVKQKIMFADFLEHISENVHSGDTTDTSLHTLNALMLSIRETNLPKTREEFEIRANLFYLVFEMENYLNIKKKLFARTSAHT